jgi:hypothetical protein
MSKITVGPLSAVDVQKAIEALVRNKSEFEVKNQSDSLVPQRADAFELVSNRNHFYIEMSPEVFDINKVALKELGFEIQKASQNPPELEGYEPTERKIFSAESMPAIGLFEVISFLYIGCILLDWLKFHRTNEILNTTREILPNLFLVALFFPKKRRASRKFGSEGRT